MSARAPAILEAELPIIDTHHRLWVRGGHRYLIDELAADLRTGHRGLHGPAGIVGFVDLTVGDRVEPVLARAPAACASSLIQTRRIRVQHPRRRAISPRQLSAAAGHGACSMAQAP